MQNLNSVVITGNLTRDPELRTTQGGTSICSLRIAVNTRRKDGQEWVDKPNFFDLTVWGNRGVACSEHLAKGSPIGVQGRLEWREWETEHAGKRQAVQIVAEHVQFLGTGSRAPEPGSESDAAASDSGEVAVAVGADEAEGLDI